MSCPGRGILCILAIISICSCTKNVIHHVDTEPMVFSATASHSSKSIITTTNYPLDEPFVIEAIHHPSNGAESEVLIDRQTVEYSFENVFWRTENDYFWPSDGTVNFYAGSPVVPEISFSEEHGMTADWSIPGDSDTQTDLCFAEVTENCETHSALVPIVFSHALTQVCFKARTLKHYSYSRQENNLIQANVITVVLDSVKIGGIISKGVFTQKPKEWTLDESETAEYLIYRNFEGLELNCDRYDNPILQKLCNILLIPQTLREGAYLKEWHHIKVRSSITDTTTGQIVSDYTTDFPYTNELSLRRYCPVWETDIKYTFRIAVGMDPTEITTAVTDWTETKEIIIGDE